MSLAISRRGCSFWSETPNFSLMSNSSGLWPSGSDQQKVARREARINWSCLLAMVSPGHILLPAPKGIEAQNPSPCSPSPCWGTFLDWKPMGPSRLLGPFQWPRHWHRFGCPLEWCSSSTGTSQKHGEVWVRCRWLGLLKEGASRAQLVFELGLRSNEFWT